LADSDDLIIAESDNISLHIYMDSIIFLSIVLPSGSVLMSVFCVCHKREAYMVVYYACKKCVGLT